MDHAGKVIGYGITGLLAGLGFGAIASMNGSLESETRKQHSSLQILEDYDSELLKMFLDLSVMQDRHGDNFAKLHRSLVRLLTLELYFDELPRRDDWPRTASAYAGEIVKRSDRLLEFVDDYDDGEQLADYLDKIKNLSADVVHNVLTSSNHNLSTATATKE